MSKFHIAVGVPLGLATAIVSILLYLHLADGTELVRVRNSLLFSVADEARFDWDPAHPPEDFVNEDRHDDNPLAAATVGALAAAGSPDRHLEKAMALTRHLHTNWGDGVAIQSDLASTYRSILRDGHGDCADFDTVFIAMALQAGLQVREWGFGVDGFASGHKFSEVYDRALGRWVFLDVFNGFYVLDIEKGRPLSVLEFRRALLTANLDRLRVIRLSPHPFRLHDDAGAIAYYLRGADQMFLWWGNAVIRYDAEVSTRYADTLGRALQRAVAVARGEHPRLKIISSPTNDMFIQRLLYAKYELFGLLLAEVFLVFGCLMLIGRRLVRARRMRREELLLEATAKAGHA